MHISHYMSPDLVAFLDVGTQQEALKQLVNQVFKTGRLANKDSFYQAIIDRENIVSTGIGMGVAIPHAKLPAYDQFFIAIGILKTPVDWNALDDSPVRLIFMIGGPDDKPTEYLQILSHLTRAIKDEEKRKKILSLQNPHAIIELFDRI